ncbi:MAG: Isopentenyl-diphosphate delta-isomerase [Candidatus Erwinia impunctatus]|nr:Isopentenyl-diphosphate delta-isomerase [Culicoides impunctatus]
MLKKTTHSLSSHHDTQLLQRKNEHLDIVLSPSQAKTTTQTGFERWRFEHCALPEIDFSEIDLSMPWLGKTLQAPVLLSSMTGGAQRARDINQHLAKAAQTLGLAMGVGSQRVALEHQSDAGLDHTLREIAPDIPLLANMGAAQLAGQLGVSNAQRAVEMIDADALIIHLNPLQEALQHGGDRNWRGITAAIGKVVSQLKVPVIVKEVGAGLSPAVAQKLRDVGVSWLDVAGSGGTSWAAIEGERAPDEQTRTVALAFADWGIPTAEALISLRAAFPHQPLIASGGIKNGIEIAKAIALGADLVGLAAALLPSAMISSEAVTTHLKTIILQLQTACFCTGSETLSALRQAPIHLHGER